LDGTQTVFDGAGDIVDDTTGRIAKRVGGYHQSAWNVGSDVVKSGWETIDGGVKSVAGAGDTLIEQAWGGIKGGKLKSLFSHEEETTYGNF